MACSTVVVSLGGEGGAGSTLEDTGGGEGRQGVRRPAGDLSGIGEAFQAAGVCEHAPAGLVLQVLNRPMQHDGQLLAGDGAVGGASVGDAVFLGPGHALFVPGAAAGGAHAVLAGQDGHHHTPGGWGGGGKWWWREVPVMRPFSTA